MASLKSGSAPRGISPSAFSLVEVLVAMAVLALVFTGAFGALNLGYSLTGEARDRTRAAQILQTELEAMRTMNWNDLTNLPASEVFAPRGIFAEAYADRYTCTRVVTLRPNLEQIDIVLTAAWGTGKAAKSEVFHTTFTRDGLNDYYYRAF